MDLRRFAMNRNRRWLSKTCCMFAVFLAIASWAQTRGFPRSQVVSVEDLTCDGSEKPLGVGDSPLRFHWVLIASSRELLDRDNGDIWDSGKTYGALAPAVSYGGKPLNSDTAYYWKVRV